MNTEMLPPLVAFTGLSGVGKDEAARWLIDRGYQRWNFGDRIKAEVDGVIRQYFGFSAFTEVREEKAQIRPILEQWGECRYAEILHQFLTLMPHKAVNTRLVRVREAREWKKRGGVISIIRLDVPPATPWEVDRMRELIAADLIDATIDNDGSIDDLHAELAATLLTLAK